MALDLIGGGAFAVLYDRVSRAVDKNVAFKQSLRDMKRTLESLKAQAGVIQEIGVFNVEMSLRNDDVDDLQTQIIEGTKVVCGLCGVGVLSLCCTDGYGEQLDELNRNLERLLGNLRLQQARDIKEILKYARKSDDDVEELKRMVKKLLTKKEEETGENNSAAQEGEIEGNGKKQVTSSPSSSLGGRLGAAMLALYSAVLEVKDKNVMYRPLLGSIKSTLECLKPLIEDMERGNTVLNRPVKELKYFRMHIEEGVELVRKCANNGFLAKYKQNKYANRLMEMDACLQGELNVLSVQVASHVRETTSAIRTMQELIERIKESAAVKDQIEVAESSSSDEEKEGLVLLNKLEEVEAGNVGVKGSGEVPKMIKGSQEGAVMTDQVEMNEPDEVAESSSCDQEKIGLILLNKMEEVEIGADGSEVNGPREVAEFSSCDEENPGAVNFNIFKVHRLMCTKLWKLVERISKIFPDIEAARPRCSTGIEALCQLSRAIDRAKQLVQYCSESSKLYLALTGDAIVSRFQKSRNLLEQNLCQIQNWVPVILVAEISKIVLDVKAATFRLDPSEDKAGKVVRELIYLRVSASDTTEDSELKALKLVSVRLHITTAKEVLIEKRSIKKLLKKVGDSDHRKKDILTYFLYLFRKYGNLILVKKTENASVWEHASLASENSGKDWGYNQCAETKSHTGYREYEAESNMSPPEELLCGISSRLMYDPVVIASGQTYERMWIQKRFHEGNETCPKTNTELAHLSLTPNVAIRESTSKCCTKYGATIPDPMQKEALDSWENSATSISSFGSSMNDLRLQMDLSDMSFGSSDTSFNSKIEDSSNLVQIDDDSLKYRYAKQHEPEPEAPRDELPRDNGYQSNGKKTSKASGFFGKKISIFSKPSSLSSKKK